MTVDLFGISGGTVAVAASAASVGSAAAVFGIRRLIQMGQFSYHNARISTIGNPYVTKEEVLPLLDMDSPSDIVKSLHGDMAVSDEIRSFQEIDSALIKALHQSTSSMVQDTPAAVRPIVSSFVRKYEGDEVKRLLRMIGTRTEPMYPVGTVNSDLEISILNSPGIPQALEVLENHPLGVEIKKSLGQDEQSLKRIDMIIDSHVIGHFLDTGPFPRYCRRGARALGDIISDRFNIAAIIQGKAMGLDKEKIMGMLKTRGGIIGLPTLEQMVDSSSVKDAVSVLSGTHLERYLKDEADKGVTRMETALDRMLLDGSVGLSSSYSTNVGPTIRYLVSREMEMKNLRTVFRSAFSRWNKDKTRGLLVLQEGF
ncbi:MAG: V-type ATPase subunit [Thermoplasmatota archaeon]